MKTTLLKLIRQKYQYSFKENKVIEGNKTWLIDKDFLITWVISNFLEQYDHDMWFKYNVNKSKIK